VDAEHQPELSRRRFIGGTGVAAVGVAMATPPAVTASAATTPAENLVVVGLRVNGEDTRLEIDPRSTLLDTLRGRLRLTGTRKGCDRGQCGACTVHVDGRSALACLTLAATLDGAEVTTIEGVAKGEDLHPVQQAFIDHDGFQCGFCTSGQIMSAIALIEQGHAGSDGEIRENMSGNLCRCGAYPFIRDAVRAAHEVLS
jgi:xanthine dehydrogenase YagT iron-sulfur-binding subunit